MIFQERSLTLKEFMTHEQVPLSVIQEAVLEYLRDRDDVLVFGAQAVNAYVDEPRMSQDVDIMALDGAAFAEEMRGLLNRQLGLAARTREVAGGQGFRIYQVRKPKNRHLVDVRGVVTLPPHQRLEGILVPLPEQLIAQKVVSAVNRPKTAKGMTDLADLRRLLLAFESLKTERGPVADALETAGATPEAMTAWRTMAAEEIEAEDDEAY